MNETTTDLELTQSSLPAEAVAQAFALVADLIHIAADATAAKARHEAHAAERASIAEERSKLATEREAAADHDAKTRAELAEMRKSAGNLYALARQKDADADRRAAALDERESEFPKLDDRYEQLGGTTCVRDWGPGGKAAALAAAPEEGAHFGMQPATTADLSRLAPDGTPFPASSSITVDAPIDQNKLPPLAKQPSPPARRRRREAAGLL